MREPLKVLVVSQYFWPENMRINDLVHGFEEKGHEVTVLTGVPNYPTGKIFPEFVKNPSLYNMFHDAKVVRVPMRPRGNRRFELALNYLSFLISASLLGPFKLGSYTFDVVFVYGVSPITVAIPAILIGKMKKIPVFVWVLDLWPETLQAVGAIQNPIILGYIGKVVSWIYNRADYILLQSRGFFQSVGGYCTKPIEDERVRFFPSWAEDNFSDVSGASSDLLKKDESCFTIVFAGNIGEAQDFGTILNAVEMLPAALRVRWVIVGDGRANDWLIEEVEKRKLSNVILLGRHPLEKMPALFAVADALLVSLRTNAVFAKTVPGKVQAYLASGRPVLAVIDGEAAQMIEEAGAGLVCSAGDSVALVKAVVEMAGMTKEQLNEMGASGRKYYMKNFFKPKLFDDLESYFYEATRRNGDA